MRTTDRTPASRSRIIATLLAGTMAAAALLVAPAATPAAHADDLSSLTDITFQSHDAGKLLNYNSGDNTVKPNGDLPAVDKPELGFSIVPNPDGTFQIHTAINGNCLTVGGAVDCGSQEAQWYVQPFNSTDGYRIRNLINDQCLYNNGPSDVFTKRICSNNDGMEEWKQQWDIMPRSGADSSNLRVKLRELATQYALTQFNNKSAVIPNATYKIDSDTTATMAPLANASMTGDGLSRNGTAGKVTRTGNWTTATASTISVGFDYGQSSTVKIGGGVLPVEASLTVAWTFKFNKSWTNTETVGGGYSFEVNPGAYGWVMRGQLMKSVTGTWTLTNDLGENWTGAGTANVAVPDGTDGQNSLTVQCTSDGNDSDCLAHAPAAQP